MPEYHSGFVAVIGRPNVGKSTLLNSLIGQKVAIVSDKPQTTRNTVQCVFTRPDAQIVFLDTPGLHKPLHKLGEFMMKSAFSALEEVDVILWVVDISEWRKADQFILERLELAQDQPIILVANKIDQVEQDKRGDLLERLGNKRKFTDVIGISAMSGENLENLVNKITSYLPEGPQYYPDDWITDHPERFIVAEFIREQILTRTQEEIPHSVAVDVEQIEEDTKKGLMKIRATIFVERDSQKGIIIGKNGKMLKDVGTAAREQIEGLLGTKVFLELWVKVKKDWRNKAGVLRELGYE